jgi:hypothetical protein
MGLKVHQPEIKNTIDIAKRDGMYKIITIKAANAAMAKVLDGDIMNCNETTFSMPRGNTVGTFIKEIFDQELIVADKYSVNGSGIVVVVKSMVPETSNPAKGTWTIEMDYIENEKTTSIKTVNIFESKYGLMAGCVNTADIFEKSIAGNLADYFIKSR